MKNQSFLRRLGFAWTGIRSTLQSERSFRTQCAAAILVVAVLPFLGASPVWWALAFLSFALVLAAELMNTALERLADHVQPEHHEAIKIVKDCAAGAVLIASLVSVLVALCFLWDRFLKP